MNGPRNSEETAHNEANPNEDSHNAANLNEGKNILEEVAEQTCRSNRFRRTTWKIQEMEKHKNEKKAAEKGS